MRKQKTLIGPVILIKDSGAVICGGAVERKNRILQAVDIKSISIKMKNKRKSLMMKNKLRKLHAFVVVKLAI